MDEIGCIWFGKLQVSSEHLGLGFQLPDCRRSWSWSALAPGKGKSKASDFRRRGTRLDSTNDMSTRKRLSDSVYKIYKIYKVYKIDVPTT